MAELVERMSCLLMVIGFLSPPVWAQLPVGDFTQASEEQPRALPSRNKKIPVTQPTKFCSRNPDSFVCTGAESADVLLPTSLSDDPFCSLDASATFTNCVGRYRFDDGSEYVGMWEDDEMDGRGVFIYPDGDRLMGFFSVGGVEGTAAYLNANGGLLLADWEKGSPNGGGVQLTSENKVYIGEFRQDAWHGKGILLLEDLKVIGKFQEGRPFLAAVYSSSDQLIGTFRKGDWCEECPLTNEIQNVIDWDIRSFGRFDGENLSYIGFIGETGPAFAGVQLFRSGHRYVGRFKDGNRDGSGLLVYSDGSAYVGNFEGNFQSGIGSSILANGSLYIGEYEEDLAHGSGLWLFSDGDGYVGQLRAGKIEGQGLYRSSDGPVMIGINRNAKPWDVVVYEPDGRIRGTIVSGEYCSGCLPNSISRPQLDRTKLLAGTGTGFVVNRNHVVTAEHVVDECSTVSLMHGSRVIDADVVTQEKESDLAVLKTREGFHAVAGIRTNKPLQMGELAINFGFPLYGELSSSASVTSGIVSSLSGYEDDPLQFQYDAATQFGNSGGPVLDRFGDVIGVVSAKLSDKETQLVNFATNADTLGAFLTSAGVNFEQDSPVADLGIPEVAIRAADFTVLVGCFKE